MLLYDKLNKIEIDFNPCDFQIGKGCAGFRAKEDGVSAEIGCCISGCSSNGGGRCNTKNLACKSFLCDTAKNNLPSKIKKKYNGLQEDVKNIFQKKSDYWNAMGT